MIRKTQLLIAALPVAATLSFGCADSAPQRTRQEEVAARGAEVMPFDLERTTHIFEPLDDGGIQRVTADDATDREQISLIREHLAKEADAFARGDFSDPERIHGDNMPGLRELRSGYEDIEVSYSELPAGGRIRYRSSNASLVQALHGWFEAQVMDHGDHAEHQK